LGPAASHEAIADNSNTKDGAFPGPIPSESKMNTEERFLTPKPLDEAVLHLEKNPSIDPTSASTDSDQTAAFGDSPLDAATWDITSEAVESLEEDQHPEPDSTFGFNPKSSSIEEPIDLEGIEGLGGLGSREPRGADATISVCNAGWTTPIIRDGNISGNEMKTPQTLDFIRSDAQTLDFISNEGEVIQIASPMADDHITDDKGTTPSLTCGNRSIKSLEPDSNMSLHHGDQRHAMDQAAYHQGIPRRKKINPKSLGFLDPKEQFSSSPSSKSTSDTRYSLAKGMDKFGGGTQKNLVRRRKEQLEKIWTENKEFVQVKNDSTGPLQTGQYKKYAKN
jgi:hypothetical protein